MITLGIETSGLLCSVAWYSNSRTMLEYNIEKPQIHTTLLASLVKKGLEELEITVRNLGLITVSTGPGSYTGLRIGLSYCKGLCFGQNIPIVGVSNFEQMALQAPESNSPILTVINANRGRYYYALFRSKSEDISENGVAPEKELKKLCPASSALVIDYYSKIDSALNPWNKFKWIQKVRFNASFLCEIAEKKYNKQGADSIEDIEPIYLQAFAGVI